MVKMQKNDHFYAQGLRFSCKRCSTCCRFEAGFVFLSRKDTSLLAAALNMKYNEFLDAYCRWVPVGEGKKHLSLNEKPNYDCIFWGSGQSDGCLVYENRPLQCRLFPFWPSVLCSENSWQMTARDCPGMDQGMIHSHTSIKKMLAMRKMEPIISRNI